MQSRVLQDRWIKCEDPCACASSKTTEENWGRIESMRRLLATFLLAMVSIPLIAPALVADSESRLPACCRRMGKHHCAAPVGVEQTSGVGLNTAAVHCASFPGTPAAPGPHNTMGPGADRRDSIPVFAQLASSTQPRSLYHLSAGGSCPKRGPPSLLEIS